MRYITLYPTSDPQTRMHYIYDWDTKELLREYTFASVETGDAKFNRDFVKLLRVKVPERLDESRLWC